MKVKLSVGYSHTFIMDESDENLGKIIIGLLKAYIEDNPDSTYHKVEVEKWYPPEIENAE